MSKTIYLDYNATTPVDPEVLKIILPYLTENFGNPSSQHSFGIAAKKAVMEARQKVASMLKCRPEEIIFTSGGSESNNFALKGAAFAYRHKGNHIITSSVEHPSILEVCRYLEENGFDVTYLPVDEFGMVVLQDIENSIRPGTIIISVMHANNETGTIQPIKEISEIAHRFGIIVHSDCAQSIGKIPVNIDELNCDMITIAGHKIYAPKGIGALYIRSGIKLQKQIHGASHEMNFRAGTENVSQIVALGEACRLICENLSRYSEKMEELRNYFEKCLTDYFPWIRINGHIERRLPNTSSVSFKNIEANLIISALKNVAVSAGAACHSDKVDVSHVLSAMKVPVEYAMGTLRVSLGRTTSKEEIDEAVFSLKNVIEELNPEGHTDKIKLRSEDVRLTEFTSGLGCACKMRPQILEEILKSIPLPQNKNILVGIDTSDDAAVYQMNDTTAIVETVDFFTPIVDDPFEFGAVAAANSLSDIYAMGASPLFALSIAAFPSNRLPSSVLKKIVDGANYVAALAGISIIGGHTIEDIEPKFGLAVTGIVEPEKVIKNSTMKPGDILVLTKPIGTGILSTALKNGLLDVEGRSTLVGLMTRLNKAASEAMQSVGVNACTDVTGFGLLGHLLEMVRASNLSVIIDRKTIPLLPGVVDLALEGAIPGGTKNNMLYTEPFTEYDPDISDIDKLILNDAQTSGGLLISVPEEKLGILLRELELKGVSGAAAIGKVTDNTAQKIQVH